MLEGAKNIVSHVSPSTMMVLHLIPVLKGCTMTQPIVPPSPAVTKEPRVDSGFEGAFGEVELEDMCSAGRAASQCVFFFKKKIDLAGQGTSPHQHDRYSFTKLRNRSDGIGK